jgi:hypothetical protein
VRFGRHDGWNLRHRLGRADLFDADFLSAIPRDLPADINRDRAHTMRNSRFLSNTGGATALEFALCAPAFFMLVMGIVELGLLVWMQLSLQQGVEAAARCASINKIVCANTAKIQAYAAAQTYGVAPPATAFNVTPSACGNLVQASYTPAYLPTFPIPSQTLTARACFPT